MDLEEIKIRKTGTTTVGIICKDGVVLGAEKRSTLGYLIASEESQKIFPIGDHLAITIAGASGDAQALIRYMKAECKLFEIQKKRRVPVKSAATLLSNILQSGRWSYVPYMVQLIVAGFDNEGPSFYALDPIGSSEEEKKFFSTGSGSPIALGVLEDKYKDGISIEAGIELAVQAIRAAMRRDIGSGGKSIDVFAITEKGIKKIEKSPKE